jgi:hypothetical protein
MSARIGIGAGLALLVGFGIWAALPNSVGATATPGGAAVAPVAPTPPPPQAVAQRPAVDVTPAPPPSAEVRARVDACLAAQAQVAQRRATRGGPTPPGEPSDAGVVAHACAPLYHEAGCRQAQLDFDVPAAPLRVPTVLQACERAYCPMLPAPKPSVCDPAQVPGDGMETYTAWNDLRSAILRHDLGETEAARAFPPR